VRRPASAGRPAAAATLASAVIAAALGLGACRPSDPPAQVGAFDPAVFRAPPPELGPHVRWWWPGGAVDDATLAQQIGAIADAGFAGIEQQTLVFGLSPDDLRADPRVRTVGEAAQLAHLRTFVAEAHARGLHAAVTLGSGWPSGGIFQTDVRPQELLLTPVAVDGPAEVRLPVPTPTEPAWVSPANDLFPVIGAFDPTSTLVAALVAPVLDAAATPPALGAPVDVTGAVADGELALTVTSGPHLVLFVHLHPVDHVVAGAAFPGEAADAKVIDHLHPRGAATLLAEQSGPWLDALAPEVPDELFIDSFEMVGELPWSLDFDARFIEARGYSLLPELPFVLRANGESKYYDLLRPPSPPAFSSPTGERAREDYEDVRGELFQASFLTPMAAFAEARGATLRLQAHGGYAHVLDAYALAGVPESEGLYAQGAMDFLELAASAAHVSGRTTVSSESFVAVNPLGTPLSEDERWMLAGRAYVAGINRLVLHGVAYPYTRVNGAVWSPFQPDAAAGVVTAGPFPITSDIRLDAPAWSDLPAFNLALTRMSYAMTRGVDRAEVAWLLPERELRDATFVRGAELQPEQGESDISLALRRGGYGYDRISPAMLAASSASGRHLQVGAARFDALLITDWRSAEPEALDAVRRALDAGVPVLRLGDLPSRARGLQDADDRDLQIRTAAFSLFAEITVIPTADALPDLLADAQVRPPLPVQSTTCALVSQAHRELEHGDLFLVLHEHPDACEVTFDLPAGAALATALDPRTGEARALPSTTEARLELEGQRPVVLWVVRQ
jgi:hypothetical protein